MVYSRGSQLNQSVPCVIPLDGTNCYGGDSGLRFATGTEVSHVIPIRFKQSHKHRVQLMSSCSSRVLLLVCGWDAFGRLKSNFVGVVFHPSECALPRGHLSPNSAKRTIILTNSKTYRVSSATCPPTPATLGPSGTGVKISTGVTKSI